MIDLARNSGKAEAVRQGVAHAVALRRFAFIGYWDADLSTPLSELDGLLALRQHEADLGLDTEIRYAMCRKLS